MIFCDKEIPALSKDSVNKSLSVGRLPSSILLSGASTKLRETCATQLSQAVLCPHTKENGGFPCQKCISCQKVQAGIHPDVIKIAPEDGKKLLSIKVVRENCLQKLIDPPTEGENKVFLFPDCDNMQSVVQNALLKSIEEPPDDTLFIFCADAKEGFLTTVLSRVTEYNLGDSLSSKSRKTDEKTDEIASKIAHALCTGTEFDVMLASAPMVKNRKLMSDVAKKLIIVIRDALAQGCNTQSLSGLSMEAYEFSSSYKTVSLLKIKDIMDNIISQAASNANENLLISRFSAQTALILKERN